MCTHVFMDAAIAYNHKLCSYRGLGCVTHFALLGIATKKKHAHHKSPFVTALTHMHGPTPPDTFHERALQHCTSALTIFPAKLASRSPRESCPSTYFYATPCTHTNNVPNATATRSSSSRRKGNTTAWKAIPRQSRL